MKKILLLVLPVMALCIASCEKNNGDELSGDDVIQFQDPNFLKALLVVQETDLVDYETGEWIPYTMDIDLNKDGKITVNEARQAKAIVIDGSDFENEEYVENAFHNITDVSEIKYFTNLNTLWLSDINIKEVDLSNNTELTFLYCALNQQLTSLDASNHTVLKELYCVENHQLISLNASGCTALTEIESDSNQYTSLNVSGCTALTALNCGGNKLSVLDLSDCSALTYLSCSGNQLTSLDVSNNTALTWLDCEENQITTLDVSMCHDLESLQCVRFDEYGDEIYYETACPLESLRIYQNHHIGEKDMAVLEEVYGDIIEYVD